VLPPRDLHTHCPRCHVALDDEVRICGACGADRELEMSIAATLEPALASLRRWLVVLGALLLFLTGMTYAHYSGRVPPGILLWLVLPQLITAVGMFVLAALARRWPFGVSAVALGLFLVNWGLLALEDPARAFMPNLGLALRIMFLIVLYGAAKAGYQARTLRRQAAEAFPRAKASYR
jgi:hypothetical protein